MCLETTACFVMTADREGAVSRWRVCVRGSREGGQWAITAQLSLSEAQSQKVESASFASRVQDCRRNYVNTSWKRS